MQITKLTLEMCY